jgi:hypothetical protein
MRCEVGCDQHGWFGLRGWDALQLYGADLRELHQDFLPLPHSFGRLCQGHYDSLRRILQRAE